MSDTAVQQADETFATVHRLAVSARPSELSPADRWLTDRGLARRAAAGTGFELTGRGYRLHRALLDEERPSIDLTALGMRYDAVCALGRRLNDIRRLWERTQHPSADLVASLCTFASMAKVLIDQITPLLPRLNAYGPRLREAVDALCSGDLRFGTDLDVDSVAVIWSELQEDYLQTLGRGYDLEEL